MILIDAKLCTGCGACMEVCTAGALYLVDGKAAVDAALCDDCGACLAVCSSDAMALSGPMEATRREVAQPAPEPVLVPAVRREPEVIKVVARAETAPLRSKVLPVVGTALAWAGREVLPRVADLLLEALDRQAARPQANGKLQRKETSASAPQGAGRQHRHRRRGGTER